MLHKLKNFDFTLMITPLLLAVFGVVMIYSASMVSAVVEGLESTYYLKRQLQWFVLGLIAFLFCSVFPYRHYQRFIKLIILVSVVLLISVLLFGESAHNATRKVVIKSISIQPAEFVKIGLILYLASAYSKKQAYINDFFKGVLPPLVLTATVVSLIILQPDIGTSAIIFVTALAVIASSGIHFKHIFVLFSIGAVFLAIVIPNMITDVRVARVIGAYKPFTAPESIGHHLIESYLAIGVGGITGEGLGQSVQKLGYLWGAHTDFIMSIITEELGFIGVVVVVGMLSIIVLRGFYISRKCDDSFGSLLAIGISTMIGIQAFINLGAISGVLPITGVPLPFVSYGGSSLMALMISVGILNNIAMSVKTKELHPKQVDRQSIKQDIPNDFEGQRWSN